MVLSGGGARGLGHVGVLQAFAEHGVAPQVLAGTSAGAVVAALCAAGYTGEEMLEFFIEKNPFRVSKLALAKPGIFDTDKVVADFPEYFPENSFKALDKRIFLATPGPKPISSTRSVGRTPSSSIVHRLRSTLEGRLAMICRRAFPRFRSAGRTAPSATA